MSEEIKKEEEVKNEVKGEVKRVEAIKPTDAPKEATKPMRQIVIETDGDNIHLKTAEVSGKIELVAVLESVINALSQPQK